MAFYYLIVHTKFGRTLIHNAFNGLKIEQQFNQEVKQKKIVEDQLYMSQVECNNYKKQIHELQKKLKTYQSTNPSNKPQSYWDRPDNL